MLLTLPKGRQIARVDIPTDLVGVGRLEDPAVRVEDAHADQARITADHLQNLLHITGIARAHGTFQGAFDHRNHQICGAQAGIGDMGMFVVDMKYGYAADRNQEEQEGEYDDPTDQTVEKHCTPFL